MAVIIHDGLERMYAKNENVFYYITMMNENYTHPEMPKGAREGIVKGMYLLHEAKRPARKKVERVQLMGSGTILREALAAAEMLREDFGVYADVWSATSFTELTREAQAVERWNMLHPQEAPKISYVQKCLQGHGGPVIAATDYVRMYAEQIRPFVPNRYTVLGTDGYGRSDMRSALRNFFEVDRRYIAVAALKSLADEGNDMSRVSEAIARYDINPDKPNPMTV